MKLKDVLNKLDFVDDFMNAVYKLENKVDIPESLGLLIIGYIENGLKQYQELDLLYTLDTTRMMLKNICAKYASDIFLSIRSIIKSFSSKWEDINNYIEKVNVKANDSTGFAGFDFDNQTGKYQTDLVENETISTDYLKFIEYFKSHTSFIIEKLVKECIFNTCIVIY